jgi:hypothetical protein
MEFWPAVIKLVGGILTGILPPLLIQLLGALSPPVAHRLFPNLSRLRARNGWINAVACMLCLAGFISPLLLFAQDRDAGWPAVGLGFGAAVVFPYLWICLTTLPFGLWRYQEFWRFYQLYYGIGIGGIIAIYVPCAAFGAVSLIVLIGRGDWILL